MEPRWNEISKTIVRSLENAIVVEQNKIINLEIEKMMLDEFKMPPKEKDEGEIEFQNRKKQLNDAKENLPAELAQRKKRVGLLMAKYVEFLQGKSIIGSVTGPLDKIDQLFNEKEQSNETVSSD